MQIVRKEIDIGGKRITVEIGRLAKQADGAAVITCEGTSVLATVVAGDEVRQGDFLPLTVDVEEKLYAAGKIPGSFFKREGRPTEGAMLTARVIDRSLRPAFSKELKNDVQVVVSVLSTDQVNPPDVLGLIGASFALMVSNIPFNGPVGGLRVGWKNGEFIMNPTYEEIRDSALSMIVAGNEDYLMMVEAGACEVSEDTILACLEFGQKAVVSIIEDIESIAAEARKAKGEPEKQELIREISEYLRSGYQPLYSNLIRSMWSGDNESAEEARKAIADFESSISCKYQNNLRKPANILSEMIKSAIIKEILGQIIEPAIEGNFRKHLLDSSVPGLTKAERSLMRKDVREELAKPYLQVFEGFEPYVESVMEGLERKILRNQILELNLRPDGRKPRQIRKVSCEVGLLPKTHGSALFTRGETQVLTITTLGGYGERQVLDDLGIEEFKRFIHHYNFPPYSTGEARPIRGPKRREIGHGALVERGLAPLIPAEEEFPYTIRLVSEVLESNGSSSMASVCASSMSLMDAGVPLKDRAAISGIAMGLVVENGKHVILSDIQGLEDSIGDMDFKVAGTAKGVTALQMDVKCEGLTLFILEEALKQAKEGRQFIMSIMNKTISEPRKEISPNAPRVIHIEIPVDRIGDLIGPGGKTIRGLIDTYDVEIDVEDNGRVFIFGKDKEKVESARDEIKRLVKELEVGDRIIGTVVKTTNFGAFIQLAPGKDGLIHISKLGRGRVEKVEDVIKVGDKVEVEIESIDNLGRIDLRAVKLPTGKQ